MAADDDPDAVESVPAQGRDDAEIVIDDEGDDAGEDEGEDEGGRGGFDSWRRESALGAVGTGLARGLQAVFAPPAHEIAIVAAVPGEPPDADQRLQVILDPDDPTKSVAIVPKAQSTDFPSDLPSE
jgi:hypothetical protein